ncbi:MAG: HlyD family efflux transporter periplasmic adaptor subunit [Bacillota bacterium]|nr:HlyD family efflux transporter periplasmic adaptor subunit [Bacillota bacterium]
MTKKIRIRPRFYFIVIVVSALLIGLGVILLQGPSEVYAQAGSITFEKETDAVVMRDERIVRTENYGKTVFAVSEGEKVEQGVKVADVYKWGYNENSLKDLMDIQQKIKDYQENNILRDILDKDLDGINSKISENEDEMASIVSGKQRGDLLGLQRGLEALMLQRRAYLKKTVKADEELTGLYNQEDELLRRIDSWKIEILADAPGIASFYLDGCEDLLRLENMEKVTYADLKNIIKGLGKSQSKETASLKPLYRLVNDGKWYCLLLSQGEALSALRPDTVLDVNFEGFYEKTYEAKVTAVREMEDGAWITILEINDAIGSMLDVRRVKAHLRTDFSGIMIPFSAVKTQDGKEGVYLIDGNSKRFVIVDVLAKDGENCIIRPRYAGDDIPVNQKISLK